MLGIFGLTGGAFFFGREHERNQLKRMPSELTKLVSETKNPQKFSTTLAVQLLNLFGGVTMTGKTITDEETETATRRSFHVNVYSRLAAGSTVIPLVFEEGEWRVVLEDHVRKKALTPPDGYGKWGPLAGTKSHFSDLKPDLVDSAEERILKGEGVAEAYAIYSKGKKTPHPYGSFDQDFSEVATRELFEELGIKIDPKSLTLIEARTVYKERWKLHVHEQSYVCVIPSETIFHLDPSEVKDAHKISPSIMTEQADGSSSVQGFSLIIPAVYVGRIKKALARHLELEIEKRTEGLFTSLDQLYANAKARKVEVIPFSPLGPGFAESRQAVLALADYLAEITNHP